LLNAAFAMAILDLISHVHQYIYSIILFTVNNKHLFTANNEIHKYYTRNNNNLHPALTNLTKYNKGDHMYQVLNYLTISHNTCTYLKALDHNSLHLRFSLKCSCIIILFTLWRGIIDTKKIKYEIDILLYFIMNII
jgi:hypothetical protein